MGADKLAAATRSHSADRRDPHLPMLAIFENIGFIELMVVLVVSLLIFGRRLPEVAGQAGRTIAKLKRSIETMREETGIDREIRQAKHDIQSVIPRNLSIGEMARMASVEMEKRIQANEVDDDFAQGSSAHNGTPPAEAAPPVDPLRPSEEPPGAIPRATEPSDAPPAAPKQPGIQG